MPSVPNPPQNESREGLAEIGARLTAQSYLRRGVAARTEPIRIVLADDHTIVREGLRVLLQDAPDIDVVGEAADGTAAVAVALRLNPDIVVLDLDMPGGDGMPALGELRRVLPDVRVLILTVYAEQERLLDLLEAGACGYLTKEAASTELVEAVRVVASGEIYVRPKVARLLAAAVVPREAVESPHSHFEALSQREQTVLQRIAEGYSLTEIAEQLGISRKTVDAYKNRIHGKLGLRHRTEFVRFAIDAEVLGRSPLPPQASEHSRCRDAETADSRGGAPGPVRHRLRLP